MCGGAARVSPRAARPPPRPCAPRAHLPRPSAPPRRYKVCPFGAATQDHTSLGSFTGWKPAAGDGDGHTVMLFTGGQHCWNGPARSMTVTVECGETETLHTVDEPEKCAYAARLTTPAACDAKFARALRMELEEPADGEAEAAAAAAAHNEL